LIERAVKSEILHEHIATKYVIHMFIFVCNGLITHSSSVKLHDMDKFIIAIAAEILPHINGLKSPQQIS
jgi:hypothetical protein